MGFSNSAAQMDWIGFEDQGASLDKMVRDSVERIGVVIVARHLEETPSALRNQLAGRRGLPEGTWSICWRLDPVFRAQCANAMGEALSRPPDLSAEQAMREILVLATAGEFGNAAKEKVFELGRRMKREEP